MNIQRLKFAWARGARLQVRIEFTSTWANGNSSGYSLSGDHDWRIHPDDEHLQYGPLSTALLERLMYDEHSEYLSTAEHLMWIHLKEAGAPYPFGAEYVMAVLGFIELLADEGL